MRVDRLARERAGKVGIARVPKVPVSDDDGAKPPGFNGAVGAVGAGRDLPPVDGRLDAGHLAAERDAAAKAMRLGVALEMRAHVEMRGVLRQVIAEAEVGPGEALAARIDMEAPVGGGDAIVVVVAPHPPDVGALLVGDIGHAGPAQRLHRGQAGDAGADDAGFVGHGAAPSR